MKGTIVNYSKHKGYGFIRISLDEVAAAKDTAVHRELMPVIGDIKKCTYSHIDSFFHYNAVKEELRPLLKKGKEVEVMVDLVQIPRTTGKSFKITNVEKIY